MHKVCTTAGAPVTHTAGSWLGHAWGGRALGWGSSMLVVSATGPASPTDCCLLTGCGPHFQLSSLPDEHLCVAKSHVEHKLVTLTLYCMVALHIS